MLESLKINNYALIQSLNIDFDSGFSTLTGETGAGKSILLGALGLALGNRADTSVLSNNEQKCIIEACFNISDFKLQKAFDDIDVDYEQHTIIRREITPAGKSRSFINDTPVNLTDLKQIGQQLIDIHSQHENLALNSSVFQMKVLDAVASNADLLLGYKEVYSSFLNNKKALQELENEALKASDDADYNQFQFDQLNELGLEQINQDELEQELEVLNNAEEIQLNLANAFNLLSNSEINSLDQLKQAKQAFDKISGYFVQGSGLSERLSSCILELQDIAQETETTAESIEYNPERVIELREKLDKLFSLFQKHKVNSVKELIEYRNSLESKILKDSSYEQEINSLKETLENSTKKLEELALKLTKNRNKSIKPLTESIVGLLNDLGMPNTIFEVELIETDNFTSSGKNQINFMFSANKNHSVQNISKIASGGELSRLMLAIKYILSQKTALPTIIFDEIDTGISGEIAHKMAGIMQNMSANMQVLSITHLPQIAAKGKEHYQVFKHEVNSHVETKIKKLNGNQRVDEIAKMLSGKNITPQAIENAKALISQ